MPTPNNTAIHAPDYALHRDGVTANDAAVGVGNLTTKSQGIDMRGYTTANVQIVPTGTADPDAEVLVWSDGASRFISTGASSFAVSGAGADVCQEFSVPVNSRRILVRLSGIAGGSVDVYVSGHDLDHDV